MTRIPTWWCVQEYQTPKNFRWGARARLLQGYHFRLARASAISHDVWDERKMATEPDRQAPHGGQVESRCSKAWRHEHVRAQARAV